MLKGIVQAQGKIQKQAKPLSAEALTAVRTTANGGACGRREETGVR